MPARFQPTHAQSPRANPTRQPFATGRDKARGRDLPALKLPDLDLSRHIAAGVRPTDVQRRYLEQFLTTGIVSCHAGRSGPTGRPVVYPALGACPASSKATGDQEP